MRFPGAQVLCPSLSCAKFWERSLVRNRQGTMNSTFDRRVVQAASSDKKIVLQSHHVCVYPAATACPKTGNPCQPSSDKLFSVDVLLMLALYARMPKSVSRSRSTLHTGRLETSIFVVQRLLRRAGESAVPQDLLICS